MQGTRSEWRQDRPFQKWGFLRLPVASEILEPIWGWETRNFMRPVRRFVACDKMATNASFRSPHEVGLGGQSELDSIQERVTTVKR
jgi:hypothetical protein